MASEMPPKPASPPPGERTVRRITYLIPISGMLGVLAAVLLRRSDWAEGVAAGTALAWLNFRWLKRGVEAFTLSASNHPGGEKTRGHSASYAAAAFRYILIGIAVYVIFTYLHVPLVSIAFGLCAFAVATITASVWELLTVDRIRS